MPPKGIIVGTTFLCVTLLLGVLRGATLEPEPAPIFGWSIEFETTCYDFSVDGTQYSREVRPIFHAPEGLSLTESLALALTYYQAEFVPNQAQLPPVVTVCANPLQESLRSKPSRVR